MRIFLDAHIVFSASNPDFHTASIAGECDFLVTGDKRNFGHLFGVSVEGVTILSPAQLAEALIA